jgi:ketosteroid isomerase-like protein
VSVRRAAAALVLIAAAAAGCRQQPQGARSPVTEAEARAIAEHAEASFTTGDVNAIMKQYADGAVMFDAAIPQPSTDRKVQTGWAQTFVSMKPADYHVPDRHIQIIGPDAFVSSGTEVFTVKAGAATPTVSARFTDVFQRQRDGSWKIVHEHVSMPPTTAGQP